MTTMPNRTSGFCGKAVKIEGNRAVMEKINEKRVDDKITLPSVACSMAATTTVIHK